MADTMNDSFGRARPATGPKRPVIGPTAGEVRDSLEQLSKTSGMSLATLSRLIGCNRSYLSRYIRDRRPFELPLAHRAKLARFLGVPLHRLDADPEMH